MKLPNVLKWFRKQGQEMFWDDIGIKVDSFPEKSQVKSRDYGINVPKPEPLVDVRQVIVLRKDLNMRKGKMVAQGAHASMGFLRVRAFRDSIVTADQKDPETIYADIKLDREEANWLEGEHTKVTLSVDSEEALENLAHSAEEAGLRVYRVVDKGFTEFNGVPTFTAIAIGPHEKSKIDPFTSDLKLL